MCLYYASEAWSVKVRHEVKWDRHETGCSEDVWVGTELRELLGLEPVSLLIRSSRLCWFA